MSDIPFPAPPPTSSSSTPLPHRPPSYPFPPPRRRSLRSRWSSSPFLRVGLPFLSFLTLSTVFLSAFLSDQHEQQRRKQKWENTEKDLIEQTNRTPSSPHLKGTDQRAGKVAEGKKQFDLQAEYEKMVGGLDLNSFENVRVPRPNEIAARTKARQAEKQRGQPRPSTPLPAGEET